MHRAPVALHPAKMRSAGRLRSLVVQAGRGAASQASASSRFMAEKHARLAAHLDCLQKSIRFEANWYYSNQSGKKGNRFSVFIANSLEYLAQQRLLPATLETQALVQQAWQYDGLLPDQRLLFCSKLKHVLDDLEQVYGLGSRVMAGSGGDGGNFASSAVPQQPSSAVGTTPPVLQQQSTPGATQQQLQQGTLQGMSSRQDDGCGAPMLSRKAPVPVNAPAASSGAGEAAFVHHGLDEWDLTLEQQLHHPFQPPDQSTLLRPVPIVFDLETSGLGRSCVPIECGAVAASSGAEFRGVVSLPAGKTLDPGVATLTGLSDAFLAEQGRPFEEVYLRFVSFLRQQVQEAGPGSYLVLIGHNIKKFDLRVLTTAANRAGLPLLRHARFLDTYMLAQHLFPSSQKGSPGQPDSLKLDELFNFFSGQLPQQSHQAVVDCRNNLLVLQGLLQHLPGPLDGDLQSRLHSAVWQQGGSWCGWVDSLVHDSQSTAKPAAKRRKPVSPFSRAARSSSLVDSLAVTAPAAGAAQQQQQQEWDAWDPVVEAEMETREGAGLAGQDRRAKVELLQQGWRELQQSVELRYSFLTTPLSQLKRPRVFTAYEHKQLEREGILSIGQLLDCYPTRLLTSQPGRLPEEGDDNPVVTLVARRIKPPVVNKSPKGLFLTAAFEALHPSEAGLDVPWLPLELYTGRRCKLQVFEFRPTYAGPWAVHQKATSLRGAGDVVVLSGPVKHQQTSHSGGQDTWQFVSGSWKVLSVEEAREAFCQAHSSAQVRVVHPSKGGITPDKMAKLVDKALAVAQEAEDAGRLQDPLPDWMREQYQLLPLMCALQGVHKPSGEAQLEESRQRLAFQELLGVQLKMLVQRNMAGAGLDSGVKVGSSLLLQLARDALPYELTNGQQAALDSILKQMQGWPPMQCLLQGDVGCGKTAVAFLALLAAVGSGYQGAIMAPTEILAEQHYRNLQTLVQAINRAAGKAGVRGFKQPRIALVTGSVRGKARSQVDESLANGEIDIAVGTHALISDTTLFKRLGLAVVDEQHKFGVEQRGRLLAKGSPPPHVLHMTATPIPRTQALIEYGSMAQVVIQELPTGRTPVHTRMLQDNSPDREQMYEHIKQEMQAGHRIYIVCPFVETSDKMEEVKAATSELERLVEEGVFAQQDCGLLHGQMPPEHKDAVLQQFKQADVKVLVSTTVVEVGVDVPEATVMVVEHAERFGFAQLHQLRGRVGRSHRQSYCYLVYAADAGAVVEKKMKVLVNHSNGFTVAECDLEMRGAGEVLGKRQSGRDTRTSFKMAQIPADRDLLEQARQAASSLLQQEPDPRRWPAELCALVMDESMLQLDTLTVPNLS